MRDQSEAQRLLAASHALLGQRKEARFHAGQVLKVTQTFQFSTGAMCLPIRIRNDLLVLYRGVTKGWSQVIASHAEVSPFNLRRARRSDYGFVERLYLNTMQPLLTELSSWDKSEVVSRFKRSLKLRETQIIGVDGQDIGFLQISEDQYAVTLVQIHIKSAFRCHGIGTRLVMGLLCDAAAKGKPVLLSVVRGNRARVLYERLGFLIGGEDATKLHMRWMPPPLASQALG